LSRQLAYSLFILEIHNIKETFIMVENPLTQELCTAAMLGNLEKIKPLVGQGADVNGYKTDELGNRLSVLLWAIAFGQAEAAVFLIENGGDVQTRDSHGKTTLMWSVGRDNLGLTRLLVDKGVDVQAVDDQGMAALMEAAVSGLVEAAQLLLDKGAEINARDQQGRTALLHAMGQWRAPLDMVTLLVARGADIQAQDSLGNTPLMRAAWGCKLDVVQFLVEHGADVHARDLQGKTVLDLFETPDFRHSSPVVKGYLLEIRERLIM
jgi:ankyrin repeat protein